MDSAWRIELLGGLRASRDRRAVNRFKTRKVGALLAFLASPPGRDHPRETLIEWLWPDCDPSAGRQSLSQALSSLRHQLEPPGVAPGAVLAATRTDVRLEARSCITDVMEFESAARIARTARGKAEKRGALERAFSLYRGELLPGHYDDWALHERDRLVEIFHSVVEQLIAAAEEERDLPRALDLARRAVEADPLREDAHRHLIRLSAESGAIDVALRRYRRLTILLRRELGVAPSAETRSLVRAIEVRSFAPGAARAERGGTAEGRRRVRIPMPAGTVSFLFAETAGAGEAGAGAREAIERARGVIGHHGGYETRRAEGSLLAAFASPRWRATAW